MIVVLALVGIIVVLVAACLLKSTKTIGPTEKWLDDPIRVIRTNASIVSPQTKGFK